MARDLAANCDIIEQTTSQIEKLAPRVIETYSRKITDRINQMLSKFEVIHPGPGINPRGGHFCRTSRYFRGNRATQQPCRSVSGNFERMSRLMAGSSIF